MRRILLSLLVGIAMIVSVGTPAAAGPPKPGSIFTADDTIHVGPDLFDGQLPLAAGEASPAQRSLGPSVAAAAAPTVGEVRNWLALDDTLGGFYRKGFTLRGIGAHVEIWVASERRSVGGVFSSGTDFPDGDCRNGPRTVITDAQVAYLIGQFDNNILPKESVAFSIAPDRDGSTAAAPAPTYNPAGPGGNTVVLVDNVRDDNFYDTNNTNGFSYIAGFFSSGLNDFFDRNIMSIDAFDWLHRTGANPPNQPVPGNNCTSAPARPFLYEGVFAHEYQHLLLSYVDPDEVNWINEGLSDWAQTLTGYVTPSRPITNVGFDSHIQCFLGWLGVATPANPNPRAASGPENSLTRWGDQGDGEILCDYGAAYSMMEFLHGRYRTSFMTALHRGQANGIAGLQEALNRVSRKLKAMDVLHDWSVMVAVDGLLDKGLKLEGKKKKKDLTTPTLNATINWDTPHAYDTAGAPSNGADYVRLRNATGGYLRGSQIKSLSFTGARTLPSRPVQWTVDPNPPFQAANPALYSGAADDRDEAIVRQVAVPTGAGAVLAFNALWNEELGWDFGFAQISTDAGVTYKSLTCTDTTTETNPDALPTAKENVPGFTGYSGAWKPQTCSLSTYAGTTVLLAFRAFNDPAFLGESAAIPPGFWVDDVTVGGTVVSNGTTLDGWRSFTQVRPVPVAGFTVHLVSVNSRSGKITVVRLPLTSNFTLADRKDGDKDKDNDDEDDNDKDRRGDDVDNFVDERAEFVAAIIFYDDPTETSTQYAPYRLTVNGVVQPGGGG